jgi:hypothetical protein
MINNSSNNNKTNNYLSPQTIEHKKDLHIYGMYFHVSDWHTSQTSFNKYTLLSQFTKHLFWMKTS